MSAVFWLLLIALVSWALRASHRVAELQDWDDTTPPRRIAAIGIRYAATPLACAWATQTLFDAGLSGWLSLGAGCVVAGLGVDLSSRVRRGHRHQLYDVSSEDGVRPAPEP